MLPTRNQRKPQIQIRQTAMGASGVKSAHSEDKKTALTAKAAKGVLAKDTHGSTIRLAPPIVVTVEDLDWAVEQLAAVLAELSGP